MKKHVLRLIASVLLSVTLLFSSSFAQSIPQSPSKATAMQANPEKPSQEQHVQMHNAINALEQAKHHPELAHHDFGGHREKALDHVQEALRECHEALEFVDQK